MRSGKRLLFDLGVRGRGEAAGRIMAKRKPAKVSMTQDEARSLLQETGLRRTGSRVAVLCELANASAPLSHAEVAERLDRSGFVRRRFFAACAI